MASLDDIKKLKKILSTNFRDDKQYIEVCDENFHVLKVFKRNGNTYDEIDTEMEGYTTFHPKKDPANKL